MLLVLLLGLIGLLFLLVGVLLLVKDHEEAGAFCTILGVIWVVLMIVVIPIDYFSRVGTMAKMEAFYDANASNYAVASRWIVIYLHTDEFIEQQDRADYINQAIRDYRDMVVWFNQKLTVYRALDKNLWIGAFYPTLREDLRLLIME